MRRDLALLAAFFRLVSTAVFATAELFYFAASLILGGAGYLKTFSPDQLNTLALLSLKLYGYGGGIFLVFYGAASILLGYLIVKSGFLPKVLGALLALGGLGFVIRNFALVLAPAYASSFLLLPMIVAALSLTVWLLVRGVDLKKWEENAAHGSAPSLEATVTFDVSPRQVAWPRLVTCSSDSLVPHSTTGSSCEVVPRFVWKSKVAHSSGWLTTNRSPWRATTGGTRRGPNYQEVGRRKEG